jgi:hypothetical protein
MRRTMMLLGALALVAPSLSAQQVRWNDRPTSTWSEEAPRVRVTIDGNRAITSGTPLRVRFEVSDNAFVTVVSVDDDGRMQSLYPYSRNQRAAVRGGQIYYARNPRLGGEYSFVATGRMGGYVFALASYAPLNFASFENRDYDRIGGYSRFTLANRSIARRPDVFIDRFAATVLWDTDTPYDYDVDYYFPIRYPSSTMSAYALCSSLTRYGGSAYGGVPWWQYVDYELTPYPLRSMCRDFYQGMYCLGWASLFSYQGCNFGTVATAGPVTPVPGQPTDTAVVPNEGVVRGGLAAPTPVPIPVGAGDPAPPVERVGGGRFDQARGVGSDLDDVLSIPTRATRKMKEDDARREKAAAGSSASARGGFDRTEASTKPEKNRVADADAVSRPPSREPTKAKNTGDANRDTRSRTGFGSTGRTSEPRSNGPDRVSRPVDTKSTGTGSGSSGGSPSIQGTATGDKKKPPTD